MTPQAQTLYSVFLFCALAGLQHWLNRRDRLSRHFREGVAVTLSSGTEKER